MSDNNKKPNICKLYKSTKTLSVSGSELECVEISVEHEDEQVALRLFKELQGE